MYHLKRLDDASHYRLALPSLMEFVENGYHFLIRCGSITSHITIHIKCVADHDITTPPTLPEITVPKGYAYNIKLCALFNCYRNLETIGNALDSLIPHGAHIINISDMFRRCTSLYEADILNRIDLPNLRDASCLFYGCRFISGAYDFLADIFRRSKTINVTNMIYGSSYITGGYHWPQPD